MALLMTYTYHSFCARSLSQCPSLTLRREPLEPADGIEEKLSNDSEVK